MSCNHEIVDTDMSTVQYGETDNPPRRRRSRGGRAGGHKEQEDTRRRRSRGGRAGRTKVEASRRRLSL